MIAVPTICDHRQKKMQHNRHLENSVRWIYLVIDRKQNLDNAEINLLVTQITTINLKKKFN